MKSFFLKIRNFLLRRFSDPIEFSRKLGVKIGKACRLVGEVNFGSEPYLVSIGDHVSITNSQFITHDGGIWVFRDKIPEADVFGTIKIGNNVFIGANCIILPGANIGDNVVIGAGSIVTKDLPSGYVYAGIPARKIKTLEEYFQSLSPKIHLTKSMNSLEKRFFLEKFYGNLGCSEKE